MRRASLLLLAVFAMPAAASGQAPSSDSQTLQALLTEVRALRQDLQTSLARVQSSQILLSRLQIQETAVTRASQQLDEARSKLTEVQVVQKSETAEIKRFQDALGTADNPEQQKEIQDALSRAQSDFDASATAEQQRQTAEIEAEQQLRTEQDKLNTLEAQLDELVKNLGNLSEPSGRVPR
jgi:DNA repair exonuclease SbcCD ATPase subunit